MNKFKELMESKNKWKISKNRGPDKGNILLYKNGDGMVEIGRFDKDLYNITITSNGDSDNDDYDFKIKDFDKEYLNRIKDYLSDDNIPKIPKNKLKELDILTDGEDWGV